MRKKTITIRIKQSYYEKVKEKARKQGVSISEFLNKIGTLYMNKGSIDMDRKEIRSSLQKVNIYLTEKDRKRFKKEVAQLGVSLSYFFNSALYYYFNYERDRPSIRHKNNSDHYTIFDVIDSGKTTVVNFYIDPALKGELDMHAIENDKTKTKVILEAMKNLNETELKKVNYRGYMELQSSFIADKAFKVKLSNQARELEISKSELINRALHLYLIGEQKL